MERTRKWADAARHPIAWFSALLRGIDRSDDGLIDRALAELDALGFQVRLVQVRRNAQQACDEAEGQGVAP
jgi:hypothetical protein